MTDVPPVRLYRPGEQPPAWDQPVPAPAQDTPAPSTPSIDFSVTPPSTPPATPAPSVTPAPTPTAAPSPTPEPATQPPAAAAEPAPQSTAQVLAALDHVRHPRARVFINRQAVAITPISADVISNNYYAADTFRVTLAYSALPPGLDAKYFADADAIECEVQYQLEPVPKPQTATAGTAKATASADTAWTSMIIGRVDEADINFSEYEIVLVGRDYSSVFMDEQTSDKFANQTSSEIVASIVDKHSAEQIQKAITATKAPVGTYFPTEHAQVSRQVTQWQLMSFLAEQEGFDLFMKGRTLHFEPSHQQGSPVYAIRYTPPGSGSVGIGTLQTLIATRSMTVAKDVQVTVLSWNSKQGRAVKVTVKKSRQAGPAAHGRHTAGIPGGSTAQRYVFRVPGLTEQQATDLANKKLAEISRHERIVEGMGPADLVLQPRMMVRLQATGTAFDQDYFCDAVERSMSFHEGFVMRIRLKNHSPESQVAL